MRTLVTCDVCGLECSHERPLWHVDGRRTPAPCSVDVCSPGCLKHLADVLEKSDTRPATLPGIDTPTRPDGGTLGAP